MTYADAQQAAAASQPALTATLLVQCPDQRGVVAALAQLLAGFNCNILESGEVYTPIFLRETQ